MNIDAAIKAAQERLHRQIGQWGRFAHRKVKERVYMEREEMQFLADLDDALKPRAGDLMAQMAWTEGYWMSRP